RVREVRGAGAGGDDAVVRVRARERRARGVVVDVRDDGDGLIGGDRRRAAAGWEELLGARIHERREAGLDEAIDRGRRGGVGGSGERCPGWRRGRGGWATSEPPAKL